MATIGLAVSQSPQGASKGANHDCDKPALGTFGCGSLGAE
jgi:hypothetical protein